MALTEQIKRVIANALAEDIGPGDVTSNAIIPPDSPLRGQFLVKAPGVIAGLEVVREVFAQVDRGITYLTLVEDGAAVAKGDVVARVEGDGPGILTAERVALNFLQRMSGIATATRAYVQAVAGTWAKILDTRKTVPGLRALDKLAVKLGGGSNHRFGLYDMVLIKDNHIAAAGSITAAVRRVREHVKGLAPDRVIRGQAIEVEVTSLEQLEEALALGVERIMLDNMSLRMMREAVRRTAGRAELEASGGITLGPRSSPRTRGRGVAQVAATGVDFISVGALTHSVVGLDISLEITMTPSREGA